MLLERAILVPPLLLLSGYFAGTETALFSLSGAQRKAFAQGADAGDSAAARLLWLLSNPRRLITTLILANELCNISISGLMTTALAGLVKLLPGRAAAVLSDGPVLAVLATLATVPLIIFLAELIPKTIGIKLAPRWARAVAYPTTVLTWLLWIPRVLINLVAGAVTFFFVDPRARHREVAPPLREQEFRTLVDLGSAEGEIEGLERRLIHNVFEFGDKTVGQVMTPAERVFALPADMPLVRVLEAVSRERYSRVPMYRGRRDNIVGVLFAKDLIGYSRADLLRRPVGELVHPPLFVPRKAKCDRLFREFQRRKTHMALVVDEYGRLAGLVTMEDLLLALFQGLGSLEAASSEPAPAPPATVAPVAPADDREEGDGG